MGVKGLLKFLESITKKSKISNFKNKKAAVDIAPWLFKGVFSLGTDEISESNCTFLNYPLKMIDLLLKNKIDPIIIFYGKKVPIIKNSLKKNKKQKERRHDRGTKLLLKGEEQTGNTLMTKSLCIKQWMIDTLIDVLHYLNIKYIVSPYEVDSQIGYLYKTNKIDFAISENSSLFAYECDNIVFKLNLDGTCDHINLSTVFHQQSNPKITNKEILEINELGRERFKWLCVVSGNEYVENFKGISLSKSIKVIKQCLTIEDLKGKLINQEKILEIDKLESFWKAFDKSILLINYAWVFDQTNNKIVNFKDPKNIDKNILYKAIGDPFDEENIILHIQGLYDFLSECERNRYNEDKILDILKIVCKKSKNFCFNSPLLDKAYKEVEKSLEEDFPSKMPDYYQNKEKETNQKDDQSFIKVDPIISNDLNNSLMSIKNIPKEENLTKNELNKENQISISNTEFDLGQNITPELISNMKRNSPEDRSQEFEESLSNQFNTKKMKLS